MAAKAGFGAQSHVGPAATEKATDAADAALGTTAANPGEQTKPTSSDMQAFIGRQLRAVYDDIAQQPVPDRFLELMRQLESKTQTG